MSKILCIRNCESIGSIANTYFGVQAYKDEIYDYENNRWREDIIQLSKNGKYLGLFYRSDFIDLALERERQIKTILYDI